MADFDLSERLTFIQAMIDQPPDVSQAPPFVRGMNLQGTRFVAVSEGRFDLEWTIEEHLTHYDGIVQGGVVTVIADTGQSFAVTTSSEEMGTVSTAEFTVRYFRPMRAGDVIDVSSVVINRSRRLGVVESRFTNQATGKLTAIVTGAWMPVSRDLIPPESADADSSG